MTRADLGALVLSLLTLGALYAYLWTDHGPADQVMVATNGKTRDFPLDRDRRIVANGLQGRSVIELSHGRARFVSSPCSGKLCIHAGWLTRAGETAACVPNGVIISLTGTNDRYDAINF